MYHPDDIRISFSGWQKIPRMVVPRIWQLRGRIKPVLLKMDFWGFEKPHPDQDLSRLSRKRHGIELRLQMNSLIVNVKLRIFQRGEDSRYLSNMNCRDAEQYMRELKPTRFPLIRPWMHFIRRGSLATFLLIKKKAWDRSDDYASGLTWKEYLEEDLMVSQSIRSKWCWLRNWQFYQRWGRTCGEADGLKRQKACSWIKMKPKFCEQASCKRAMTAKKN